MFLGANRCALGELTWIIRKRIDALEPVADVHPAVMSLVIHHDLIRQQPVIHSGARNYPPVVVVARPAQGCQRGEQAASSRRRRGRGSTAVPRLDRRQRRMQRRHATVYSVCRVLLHDHRQQRRGFAITRRLQAAAVPFLPDVPRAAAHQDVLTDHATSRVAWRSRDKAWMITLLWTIWHGLLLYHIWYLYLYILYLIFIFIYVILDIYIYIYHVSYLNLYMLYLIFLFIYNIFDIYIYICYIWYLYMLYLIFIFIYIYIYLIYIYIYLYIFDIYIYICFTWYLYLYIIFDIYIHMYYIWYLYLYIYYI